MPFARRHGRHRRARRLRATARGSSSASWFTPTRPAITLPPLHARRDRSGDDRSDARDDDRRPLRRDDRRRIDRLLHDPGSPGHDRRPGHRHERRHLQGRRLRIAATLTRVSTGSAEPATPIPATRSETRTTGTSSPAIGRLQRRRRSAAGAESRRGSGTIYFLSPEQLDGGGGRRTRPTSTSHSRAPGRNSSPRSSQALTAPDPPNEYHAYTHSFASVPRPDFMAVDASGGPSDGDIYVADNGSQVVRKYDPDGNVITSWADNGVLDGSTTAKGPFGSISALRSAPTERSTSAYSKFQRRRRALRVRRSRFLRHRAGARRRDPAVGITVNGDGNVFYVSYGEAVERYNGVTSTQVTTGEFESGHKFGLAVDPNSGDLFVNLGGSRWAATRSTARAGCYSRTPPPATATAHRPRRSASPRSRGAGGPLDPSNGDLYVDAGDRILRFDLSGQRVPGPDTGIGRLQLEQLAVGGDGRLTPTPKSPGAPTSPHSAR